MLLATCQWDGLFKITHLDLSRIINDLSLAGILVRKPCLHIKDPTEIFQGALHTGDASFSGHVLNRE